PDRGTASETNLLHLFHFFEGAEKTERLIVERRIDSDDGHGFPAAAGPGQIVLSDVDFAVAQDRPDLAHHAGDILIDDVDQMTFGAELDAEVVDRHDPLILFAE